MAMQSHTDIILEYLNVHRDVYISGQAVADELGVTRAAVWKAIESLRADGYAVESLKAKGYRLTGMPDLLGSREIGLGLATKYIGRTLHALGEVDSTNTYAARLAAEDAPEGTVVVAESQTRGRGRLGRRWVSPPGMNIYASIVLRPGFAPARAPMITLVASVALVRAVRGLYGLPAEIKWPNDMLISGKKSAGILTEMSADPDMVRHIVLGVGVDVNMPKTAFPEEIRDVSSSIMLELGRKVNRAELLRRFLEELELSYTAFKDGKRSELIDDWRSLTGMLGKKVRVSLPSGDMEGIAADLNEDGFLLVKKKDGALVTVTSGDVVIL